MKDLIRNTYLGTKETAPNSDLNSDINDTNDRQLFTWDYLITAIALRIRESLDLPTILQATADEVLQLLGCERVLLYQFAPDWSGQVVVESVSEPQFSLIDRVVPDFCFDDAWLEPFRQGQFSARTDIVDDHSLTPCHAEFLAKYQVRANLVCPILYQSQLWGFLVAHNCTTPRQWLPEEINGLQQIAVHVGIALYQADLLEQLQLAQLDLESQVQARTSELTETNQQLLQNETRFLEISESSPSIIHIYIQRGDGSSYFEHISRAIETIMEISVAQILENAAVFLDRIHPEDRAAYEAELKRSLEGQHTFCHEWRMITPSGTVKWVKGRSRAKRRDNGEVAWYGVVIDISDRKQAEAALRDSEARWQFALEGTGDGVWDWNMQTNTVFYSRQWREMLGYAEEEIGNDIYEWKTRVHPDDIAQCYEDLNKHFHGEVPIYQNEHRVRCKDGSYKWLLDRGKVIEWTNDGQPLRVIGIHNDISDRKNSQAIIEESEARFRYLADYAPVLIWLSGLDKLCYHFNQKWLEFTGRTMEQEMGNGWAEGVHPEDFQYCLDTYINSFEARQNFEMEYRLKRFDGEYRWLLDTGVPRFDANGEFLGYIGSCVDISDHKFVELALRQSELDLKFANQQLSDRIAELNQRHQEMVTLSEISDFLQACLTVEEACNALSKLVASLFPHCAGGVFITNTSRNRVEVMSSWGESLQSEDAFLPKDCWALRRGRLHFHADNGVSCNHIPLNETIAATLCIPMIAQGETIGLFYLSTNTATALPESKQQLARTLAEQVGLAIANLRLQETLQQQSIRDPLTGLFNRRYLEESLNQELSRAQRQQHQIGVIMIDIDHFKKFNDTYGHDAGDYVLQTVGSLLKSYVRGFDIACRYGGEEMILVLPESSLEIASKRAEEIREAIAQITLSHNSQLLGSLTASFGVANFPQHGATSNAVMQAADAALYRAKAAGRNQVLTAP